MEKQEVKFLEKKIKENMKVDKKHKAIRYSLWTFFGILLMIGGVFATTVITDTNVNSPTGTYTNITSDRINEVLYVQAGNGSDIQVTLDECKNQNCTTYIPSGKYNITSTINLYEGSILILDKEAILFPGIEDINIINIGETSTLRGGEIRASTSYSGLTYTGSAIFLNASNQRFTSPYTEISDIKIFMDWAGTGKGMEFLTESDGGAFSRVRVHDIEISGGEYGIILNMKCSGGSTSCYFSSNNFDNLNLNYQKYGFYHNYSLWDDNRMFRNFFNNMMIHPTTGSLMGFTSGGQADYINLVVWDATTYLNNFTINFTGSAGGNYLVYGGGYDEIIDVDFASRGNTIMTHSEGGHTTNQIDILKTNSINSTNSYVNNSYITNSEIETLTVNTIKSNYLNIFDSSYLLFSASGKDFNNDSKKLYASGQYSRILNATSNSNITFENGKIVFHGDGLGNGEIGGLNGDIINYTGIDFTYYGCVNGTFSRITSSLISDYSNSHRGGLRVSDAHKLWFRMSNQSNDYKTVISGTNTILDNVEYCVGVTGKKNGSNTDIKLYIDGERSEAGSSQMDGHNTNPIFASLGARPTNIAMEGTLRDVLIFGRALSEDEMRFLYYKNRDSVQYSYVKTNGNNTVDGDIKPYTNSIHSLGTSLLRWLKGWFVDIDVSGTANMMNATINETGYFKILSNTTLRTCDVTSEGAIYYDGNTNKHRGCDGTNWNDLY